MNVILLSGGSGKRLWPLSNEVRSKQFLKILKKEDGTYESMVQRVYRKIHEIDSDATITVATSAMQVSALRNQLGDDVGISVEPCRRDTFPAIVLASAFLKDVEHVSEDEVVVVCPVDPYVDDAYFHALAKLGILAQDEGTNLTLMGIEPLSPSEKFGYIIPEEKTEVSRVDSFKEKPSAKLAERYIEQGALWNGGVFAYKLGYVLKKAHELISFTDYADLYAKYDTLEKISFDYAVVEHEEKTQVMRFCGDWKDLGTWNALTEAMEDHGLGNVIISDSCRDTHIINELDIPILGVGLKNVIVSASPDGVLVADKDQSDQIKPFVDGMKQEVMYAEKSYGTYHVLDISDQSMTIKVILKAGQHMTYHSHEHRDEIWNVASGTGRCIVDGMEQAVHPGDVITMQAGCRHTLIAETDLNVIELQIGSHIHVDDKIVYDWKF